MSEENNPEQSSEQVIDSSDQSASISQEGTQQASTGEQVDASSSIDTNGSEVGLVKPAPETVDSGAEFSQGLDGLVQAALNGGLSDEQRGMLDKQGLGDHFDMIVSGHQAAIAKNDAEIVGVVGSKEAYGELQEWAISNLDDSEIESYNMAVLESGNIGLAKLAVEGLQARYHKANGQAPEKRIEAGGTANDKTRPYSNQMEYINETRSMEYRSDPEYAAQVEAKRNLSGF
jgi:hypothetical protein